MADITSTIIKPASGSLTDEELQVAVTVNSLYEVKSVVVSVNDREVGLLFSNCAYPSKYDECNSGWSGTIPLSGLERGEKLLIVRTTDVFNNSSEQRRSFIYDKKPSISVTEPINDSVAQPFLHIVGNCTDDDSIGCASINAKINNTVIATGQFSIDETVSLADYDGSSVAIRIEGTDSAGQKTYISRNVFVESSKKLHEVESVTGKIWDVHPDRILFLETSEDNTALKIMDTVQRTTTVVLDQAGKVPQYGFLTPNGAMYVERSPDNLYPNFTYDALYEFKNGNTEFIGIPRSKIKVIGNYAVWNAYSSIDHKEYIYLRDLLSGVSTEVVQITNYGPRPIYDLSADGAVVYQIGAGVVFDRNILHYKSGITSRITNDIGASSGIPLWYMNMSPKTDGVNTAYIKQEYRNPGGYGNQSLYLHTNSQEVQLITFMENNTFDYRLNNGWTAYTKSGNSGQSQVWTRSPDGVQTQISYFGTNSYIDDLGPNGEVIFKNGSRLYLAQLDKTQIEISSTLGKRFYQDGKWYVVIGRSLFSIDPNDYVDTDDDGIPDDKDQCPGTISGSVVDENGCAASQKDSDGDGVTDDKDVCSNTATGVNVDVNGCSSSQLDTDNDGVMDDIDECPKTPSEEQADNKGCSPSQRDSDNDGLKDNEDLCPNTPSGEDVDVNGCSSSQIDSDGDGVPDDQDECPGTLSEINCIDLNGCSHTQKDEKIESMFTKEQLDTAILNERMKWDINGDDKISIEEAINALQITTGVKTE